MKYKGNCFKDIFIDLNIAQTVDQLNAQTQSFNKTYKWTHLSEQVNKHTFPTKRDKLGFPHNLAAYHRVFWNSDQVDCLLGNQGLIMYKKYSTNGINKFNKSEEVVKKISSP